MYENDYCDSVGHYVTELCPTAHHGARWSSPDSRQWANTQVASVGWTTPSVLDCPTYNVVKQAHNVDPFREHPLDNVGCDRDEVSNNYHNLGNKYIRELRHLIDERTAALSEIQRFMRLPDWHPGALRLQ